MKDSQLKNVLIKHIKASSEAHLAEVYDEIMSILKCSKPYNLSIEEELAINEALMLKEGTRAYTSLEVKEEAKKRFPNLNFDEKD